MSSLIDLVEAVRAIPYARPSERTKRALEERHCDPAVREPYIASLST